MNRIGKISLVLSFLCLTSVLGLKLAMSGWMPFLSFGIGFGLFFFVFAVVLNFRFFRSIFHSESLKFLLQSLITILLGFSILFSLNYVVAKFSNGIDITSDKIHSLSDLSQSLVKAIPENVRFVYFHADNSRVENYERIVRNEIKRYQDLSHKIQFESYSIFKRPDLALEFKVGSEESSLYAKYKDRIERVTGITEVDITNALLKLTKPAKKIYFIESHDERKIFDESTFGLSNLKKELTRLHYKVERLESLNEIPKDAVILVTAGAKKPYSNDDIASLKSFITQGGALLMAVDPMENHGLHSFFLEQSIKVHDHFIFSDQKQAQKSPLLVPTHKGESTHEISNGLEEGQNPYLFISSSIEILKTQAKDILITPILEHLPTSVGRKDIVETSPIVSQGRQNAAVFIEGTKEPFYRIVVIADSDFLTNQFNSQIGNFDFTMSLMTFLSKDEDLLKLKTRVPHTTYLLLTQTQLNIYFLFFVLPFVSLFFILALFFKLRRFF